MKHSEQIEQFKSWLDAHLNCEKTPKKNIFWLDTMKFLCGKFNSPEKYAPCFHVAGSKGKGSMTAFIGSILAAAGYRTGLYTSPHIRDFLERISSAKGFFDEKTYSESAAELMEGMELLKEEPFLKKRPATWFELMTLYSFLTFRRAHVDYSVFEVGLGGRLDATNVVAPLASLIGPIEREHTEFLGDTLEKIAFEKGGVIKENTPVVAAVQNPSVRKVLRKTAQEKNADLYFIEDEIKNMTVEFKKLSQCIHNNTNRKNIYSNNGIFFHTYSEVLNKKLMSISFSSRFFSRPIQVDMQMLGVHQAWNAAMAALATKIAIPSVTEDEIERGLADAFLPARFEICTAPAQFSGIPFLILDGAHTVNSVGVAVESMRKIGVLDENSNAQKTGITLLFACAADKDADDMTGLLAGCFDAVFLTVPGATKQSDPERLKKAFSNAGIQYDFTRDFNLQIKRALSFCSERNSVLFVTGSFYLISEVKSILSECPRLPESEHSPSA